jgi:hypothetical protein
VLGAPKFLYRQAADAALACVRASVLRREQEAFYQENRARYLAAYIRERWREGREPRVRAALAARPDIA